MATARMAPEHGIVEWNRPAAAISLQDQIDRGGQLNYAEYEPGSWAEARCACGWVGSGPADEVAVKAREHIGLVPMR